ncbi:c-type cytochrome [Panacibacter ginsenosidivorans]|uniref:Photosynthetic reaction center cytochrome c subunit n=1 Tax=Panacibacter ginsenosidivorans TaxID=1813871 RepID=A0A5B8VF62_9BACT|nr:c-type cytochrome [Panacibacter ginsenosidivorans]QEC69661.1 c-type cytochrome [Panacibacter ginsenosidivorans]
MFTTNKNKLVVLLALGAFATFGMMAYTPDKPQEGYKNLQVLPKDISHEDLDKVMHGFNDALGVKCMYCHVHEGDDFRQGWKFDSDDKPEKGIARHMLRMTMGINSTYFNFENSTRTDTIHAVTCITCHRGIAHPDAKGIQEQMAGGMGGMKMSPPPPPPTPPGAPNKN